MSRLTQRRGRLAGLLMLVALGASGSGCSTEAFCFRDCADQAGAGADAQDDGTAGGGQSDAPIQVDTGVINTGDGSTPDGAAPCTPSNGSVEICDGIDNDCDGVTDNGFDMHQPSHCGTCTKNCFTQLVNADPATITCEWDGAAGHEGQCKFGACITDWHDRDGNPDNGCEWECIKTADNDVTCDNRDDDCDGLIDEDVDKCHSTTDCGQCGHACVVPHGTPTCAQDVPNVCDKVHCAILKCDDDNGDGSPDWWDLDNSIATGCEYHCVITNGGIEICGDGIDNDCDGKIDGADPDLSGDPNLGKPCFGGKTGVCVAPEHQGQSVCQGQQIVCVGPNVVVPGQLPETCNNADDDCDGVTDNHLTDVGKICGASSIFPCSFGTEQCVNGAIVCIGDINPGVEVCNGRDDDCNNVIDDNPIDATGACGQSDKGECRFGLKLCAGGAVLCSGNVDPVPETCNGKDDDCNGTIDDNLIDVGANCGQSNVPPCKFGSVQCVAGALNCVGNVDPTAEQCDGVDSDCNGLVDDKIPGAGTSCGQSDIYPCQKGSIQCVSNQMICEGATNPKVETCNGVDDDCDGIIDNHPTDAGGSCGQSNAPPCTKGTLQCQSGALVCVGNIDPKIESCNGIDDDCNGVTDDNLGGLGTDCGLSNHSPCTYGKTACQGGKVVCVGNIDPQPEVCNGKDDNCNGVIDDNPTDAGRPCGKSNISPCSYGSMQCQSGALVCVGAVDPSVELCNGRDDDCNTLVDDNPVDATGSCGVSNQGQCRFGSKVCTGGQLLCSGNVDPGPETCNGKDDDCNGTADDNLTDVGANCGQSGTSPCKLGTVQCVSASLKCVGNVDPTAEQCDGVDNDCNGVVDDKVPGTGVACGLNSTYPCRKGSIQCVSAKMTCVGEVDPANETCNGIDDDCDGIIDNHLTDAGGPCGQSGTLPCKKGTFQCQNGALTCVGNIDPKIETCNGIDDDCNGVTDDNVGGLNADCGLSNTAPCTYGKTGCQGGKIVCAGNIDPQPEVCNGKDDNCNGITDDNPTDAGGRCGSSNRFPCSYGSFQCQGGSLVCVGAVNPGLEVCNGVDDDCNGTIDDNLTDSSGPCNVPKSPPPGATSPCKAGTKACVGGAIQCQGWAGPTGTTDKCGDDSNCDGVLTNQPDMQTDIHHCGNCTTDCTAPAPHAIWTCVTGGCVFNGCQPGWWDTKGNHSCDYPCNFVSSQEACNGRDDNCNGTVDEGVVAPSPVQVCGVGPAATAPECTSQVTVACQSGNWVCTFLVAGVCNNTSCSNTTDICDGLDNNCNGATDENSPDKGKACASDDGLPPPGHGACRTTSNRLCDPTDPKHIATYCPATKASCLGLPGHCVELCDGIDNDCDGSVDETFNAPGTNATYYVKPAVTKIAASLWVYSYEASRPLASEVTAGTGNGCWSTGGSCGTVLDKTPACSDMGLSGKGRIPWFNVTPDEVTQTCLAMGGRICTSAEWRTACEATQPCTWGYALRGADCTSLSTASKFCNLGPYDFDQNPANGDQDGVLVSGSSSLSPAVLKNCWADWSTLFGNTSSTDKIYDITGNLREITYSGTAGQYKLMGGAFNTQSEVGAACSFSFYTVGSAFKFFDAGFRCCFTSNPSP